MIPVPNQEANDQTNALSILEKSKIGEKFMRQLFYFFS